MYDVVTFGEAMVRLSPPHFQRLEQARSLDLIPLQEPRDVEGATEPEARNHQLPR